MKKLWDAIKNTFLNSLTGSFKRTNIVVTDTGDKLFARKEEHGIEEIYTYFAPFKTSFGTLYLEWKQVGNTYHSLTATVERLDKEVSKKAGRWDTLIKPEFLDDPDGYKELFPKGHSAFQTGEYEEKIAAVKVLGKAIDDRSQLATVKADIIAFGSQFELARSLQQGKEGMLKKMSVDLKTEQLKVCQALYGVQGRLMSLFNTNPEAIEAFFDLETLRRTGVEEDEPAGGLILTVAPGQTLEAGIPDITGKTYQFTNHGEVPLDLFTGGETPEDPENPHTLAAGQEVTLAVADLGPAGSRYLYIKNDNPDLAGAVEIIEVTGE
jgi:hypothetical protein